MDQLEHGRQGSLGRFQKARERIGQLCREQKFAGCLESALTEERREKFQIALERLRQNDIYLGALGVQGVGKSTLLNALLFGRRILPVDVAETTVVLTKIYSADGQGEQAQVVFFDGKTRDIPLQPEILREYVDNELNPCNEKRVQELRCYADSQVLGQGICLVDTPGVASLTEEIGQVTLDFLPKISAAVFITMTTPCLTATEVDFLESAWDYCDRFFFVQNIWGENKENIEEATEDIKSKLAKIGEEHDKKVEKKVEPRIYPIDIHRAMEGMANDYREDVEASGIRTLMSDLEEYINQGAIRLRLNLFQSSLESSVQRALRAIDLRKMHLDEEGVRSAEDLRAEENQFRKRAEDTEDKWREEERQFIDRVRHTTRIAEDSVIEALDELREQMIADIEARKMDAEHIIKSFEQRVRLALKSSLSVWEREINEALNNLKKVLGDELRKLRVNFKETFGKDRGKAADEDGDNTWEDNTWEFGEKIGDFFQWAGTLGITILAGEMILSWLELTATGSAAFGPIGWAVSGGLLLGGLILKKWFEEKAVKKLRKAVTDANRAVKKEVLKKLRSAEEEWIKLADAMRKALDEEIRQLRWEIEQIRRDASKSAVERQKTRQELTECERNLKDIESKILEEIGTCLTAV